MTFEPGAAGFSLKTDLITTLKSWIDGPVPRRPDRSVVVGARGFELQTSCAQGRGPMMRTRCSIFPDFLRLPMTSTRNLSQQICL